MISDFLFSHFTKDIELMIGKDFNNKPVFYVYNPVNGKKIYLKSFLGESQYKKFLIEAVCLRMAADKQSVRKSRAAYLKLSKVLKDNSKNEQDFN